MNIKFIKRLNLIKDYLLKNPVCSSGPFELGIETTNRCNLDCQMCPRQEMKRSLGDMDIKLFKKIIDDGFSKLDFVGLQDYGEPLLNKSIFEMIEYCKIKKIRCGISTNATQLDNETGIRLLKSGLDHIILAFDGVCKTTYETIRKGAKYESVKENIRNFLDIKYKNNFKTFCVLQCIYMKETEPEIKEFMKMWHIPGVDAIRIRQVTYSGNKYKENENKKFINIKGQWPCFWLWSDPHIKWDGTMVPCCQDVNAIYPLGNIADAPFYELWNSSKMIALRKAHIAGKVNDIPLCKGCNMYQPSLPIATGILFFNVFTEKKLIPFVESAISKFRFR